jgi:hypothetical protein
MRPIHAIRATATLGATAMLAAGCGGASPAGGVAHLGTPTSPPASATASDAASPSTDANPDPGAQAEKYSACMRAHGVADFPDPIVVQNGTSTKVAVHVVPGETNTPKFASAQTACRSLLPTGRPNQPTLTPQQQAQYLTAAACIRAHGLPDFPDPVFTGGEARIPGPRHFTLSSPAVQAAIAACRSVIPAAALPNGGSSAGSSSGSS